MTSKFEMLTIQVDLTWLIQRVLEVMLTEIFYATDEALSHMQAIHSKLLMFDSFLLLLLFPMFATRI